MAQIKVTAYTVSGKEAIYDWHYGTVLNDFTGNVLVFFKDGSSMIFSTGINQYGERYWSAIGNNPKMEMTH